MKRGHSYRTVSVPSWREARNLSVDMIGYGWVRQGMKEGFLMIPRIKTNVHPVFIQVVREKENDR